MAAVGVLFIGLSKGGFGGGLGMLTTPICVLAFGALGKAPTFAIGTLLPLLCAGDAFDQFQFSNHVVARLQEIGAEYILGNHEEMLLSPAGVRAQESKQVDQQLLEWTRSRDYRFEMTIGDKTLVMFHSTPWDPRGEYIYPHSATIQRLGDIDADFAIYGHTHTQLARSLNGTLVINPGSAGDGRCPQNDRKLSYAILDTESGSVSFDNYSDPSRP